MKRFISMSLQCAGCLVKTEEQLHQCSVCVPAADLFLKEMFFCFVFFLFSSVFFFFNMAAQ